MATKTKAASKRVFRTGPRERAAMLGFKNEEDLGAVIVEWLRDNKWDVYQEVEPHRNGSVADIVAVQGPLVWIIELKLSASWELLHQALQWKGWANFVSVAVPTTGGKEHSAIFEMFCRQNGIGVIQARKSWWYGEKDGAEKYKVEEEILPQLDRKAIFRDRVKNALTDRHKTFSRAGNAKGLRFTPFKATCEEVLRRVKEKPGLTMKELMDGLKHHYHQDTTARACLAKWARRGVIEGVRVEREGKVLRFYPAVAKEAK